MKKNLYCAVDIGGTKILLLLIDGKGRVVFKEKSATPEHANPDNVIKEVSGLLKKALNVTGIINESSLLTAAGITMAGFIDHQSGIVHAMTEELKCPVLLENDANAAVIGEAYYGAAHGHQDVIYITLSTGIGGGLFLNGQLYRGSSGFAGEIGHIKPFGEGRNCNCGGCNCLETWASGKAIAYSASLMWDSNDVESGTITTSWVFEQAEAGNNLALNIIEHAADTIGLGLANLVNLLNPSCLVIGGGVASNRPEFFKMVSNKIKLEAIRPSVMITPLEIVPAQLEPEAGIWGMYALMTNQVVD